MDSRADRLDDAGNLVTENLRCLGHRHELQRLATTRVVLAPDGTLDAAASGTLRAELLGG